MPQASPLFNIKGNITIFFFFPLFDPFPARKSPGASLRRGLFLSWLVYHIGFTEALASFFPFDA